jgi:hypothetical protein
MLLERHRYVNSALLRLWGFSNDIFADLPKGYLNTTLYGIHNYRLAYKQN